MLFLGLLLLGVGVAFGHTLLPVLDAYPVSILGVMMVLAGVELARAAREIADGREVVVALITAACILGVNTGVGFLAGVAFHVASLRAREAKKT